MLRYLEEPAELMLRTILHRLNKWAGSHPAMWGIIVGCVACAAWLCTLLIVRPASYGIADVAVGSVIFGTAVGFFQGLVISRRSKRSDRTSF